MHDRSDKLSKGIALAELLAYIDEARMDEDVAPVFKLSDLVKLYASRLKELEVEQHARPHSTELKNRILLSTRQGGYSHPWQLTRLMNKTMQL